MFKFYNKHESFYKIGITTLKNIRDRFNNNYTYNYNYNLIYEAKTKRERYINMLS